MVLSLPLISNSTSLFGKTLGIVPRIPTNIGITVIFVLDFSALCQISIIIYSFESFSHYSYNFFVRAP